MTTDYSDLAVKLARERAAEGTAVQALASRIVKALLKTNALWPHPYDSDTKAYAVVEQVLRDAGIGA